MERGVNTSSIMPISDLRNYTEVLKEVEIHISDTI